MDDTAIEQDLGGVGDAVEDFQCLVELVVVVAGEGCHPGFDFLFQPSAHCFNMEGALVHRRRAHLLQRHDEWSFTSYPAVWCRQASMCNSSYSTIRAG